MLANFLTLSARQRQPLFAVHESYAIMLHLIGLGLADETDVTVKGLELIREAKRVYLEAYTSILLVDSEKLVTSRITS